MKSTRRDFIKTAALASGSLMLPRFLNAFGAEPSAAMEQLANGRKLVIVQLSGGNDGLNTIVPYRNDIYYKQRPTLAILGEQVLKVTDSLGFNKSMLPLADHFNNGQMTVINNVGYPNPDRSHFRSMDIWHTASDANEFLSTGWLGRYLDSDCSQCNTGHNAIELNDKLSLALKGTDRKGLAFDGIQYLNEVMRQTSRHPIAAVHPHDNDNLSYLYKTYAEAASSSRYIYDKSRIYKAKTSFPATDFGRDLQLIAELINSGCSTTVYYVSLGGFDTHNAQKGRQERLLKTYSDALDAFMKELKLQATLDDTLVMTFSEFGRRVKQNGSNGTDHGTANNLILMGGKLKNAGMHNSGPNLTDLDDGDLKHQIDFRNVYATLLNKWLGVDHKQLLGKGYEIMPLI